MIEPSCAICGKFDGVENKGGFYIQFEVIEPKEIAEKKSYEEFPIPGNPPGNRFFCGEHSEVAWKYHHLPYHEEAVHLIRAEISEIQRLEIERENKQLSDSFFLRLVSKIKEFFKRSSK